MVWLSDPFYPHLADPAVEVYIASDPSGPSELPTAMLCTGFMLFTTSKKSIDLVSRWIDYIVHEKYHLTNQQALYMMLGPIFRYKTRPAAMPVISILPYNTFPNGALYFNATWRHSQNSDPVIIHNNFMSGRKNKIARFVEFGLWHAE